MIPISFVTSFIRACIKLKVHCPIYQSETEIALFLDLWVCAFHFFDTNKKRTESVSQL